MQFKLLVFDLDGTLIDSTQDLADAVNAALAHLGRPPLPVSAIASYVGDGAATLIRRSLGYADDLPHEEAPVRRALDFFLDFYRVHKLDHTMLYPGVLDALHALRAADPQVLMACLTNKPVIPSREICAHFGLDRFFFQTYGGNSFATKKPHPEGLLTLIGEASQLLGQPIGARKTLMIGDSATDVLTARHGGTCSLGCTFGLAPESLRQTIPDVLVNTAAEWAAAIGSFDWETRGSEPGSLQAAVPS